MNKEVYLVKALRWGDLSAHSYIIGLYSTLESAASRADKEVKNRGGKYGCAVYALEVDSEYKYMVYYKSSVLKEPKPMYNYHQKDAEKTSLEEFTEQYKKFVDWNTPLEQVLRHLHGMAFGAGQQTEVSKDIKE